MLWMVPYPRVTRAPDAFPWVSALIQAPTTTPDSGDQESRGGGGPDKRAGLHRASGGHQCEGSGALELALGARYAR